MTDFDATLAFIPGGSTGIGLAIAKLLAAAAEDITRARRRDTQRVMWRQLDVGDAQQVRAVLGAAVAELGVPDVLINCAGRALPNYFERVTAAQLEESMRINFYGCWHAISTLLPHMRSRRGYIVNVASLAGLIGIFGYTDYAAPKFAVVGFSEALRSELAPDGITVSVLCPPDTQTPGFEFENANKTTETHVLSAGASILTADEVADALIAGMAKRRFLIIAGREARFGYLLKRFCPRFANWLMDRQVRRVRAER